MIQNREERDGPKRAMFESLLNVFPPIYLFVSLILTFMPPQ